MTSPVCLDLPMRFGEREGLYGLEAEVGDIRSHASREELKYVLRDALKKIRSLPDEPDVELVMMLTVSLVVAVAMHGPELLQHIEAHGARIPAGSA